LPRQSPAPELISQQTLALVRKKINFLPVGYRIVLFLRDIEGIAVTEVAKMLDLNKVNVRMRAHHARAALEKRLDPLFQRGAL